MVPLGLKGNLVKIKNYPRSCKFILIAGQHFATGFYREGCRTNKSEDLPHTVFVAFGRKAKELPTGAFLFLPRELPFINQ